MNRSSPRGGERFPRARSGPPGINHELAAPGGSEGRAAFWDSFPQLPTCTQPNRDSARRGLQVPEFRATAFPLHTRPLEPDPKGNP